MTKKTDDKKTKDSDKDLANEEAKKKAAEAAEEEDEESTDEDEEEDEEDDEEDEEEEEAAPAKASAKPERKRHRHEEYLEGDDESRAPAEDPTWWAPHVVLGVLVVPEVGHGFEVLVGHRTAIGVVGADRPELGFEVADTDPEREAPAAVGRLRPRPSCLQAVQRELRAENGCAGGIDHHTLHIAGDLRAEHS